MHSPEIGPYAVLEELGRGASGIVYLAEARVRTALVPRGYRVALKVLRDGADLPGDLSERMLRTALASSRIDHPNVVRVLDVGVAGEHPDTRHYLAMELCRGRTLQQVLREQGRFTEEFSRALAVQIALGIGAIHAAGMVHRDLKPANLILCEDHTLKVMDLGIARILDATRMSLPGRFFGTLAYAAPEQFGDGSSVDGRADLYSLGVILHEVLTGVNPFLGNSAGSTIQRHTTLQAPPLRAARPEVSGFIDGLVEALLRKSPADRPRDAAEVAAALLDGALPARWRSADPRADSAPVPRTGWAPRPPTVPRTQGRELEIETVRESLRRTEAGAVSLIVRGEDGSGKSRLLLDAAAALLRQSPALRAGFAAGGDPDVDLPLRALGDLLRSLLGLRDGAEEAEAALRAALGAEPDPLLIGVTMGVPAPEAWTVEGERRVTAGLAALLRALGATGPVLLAVDDAQRCDEASARALCAALRAVSALPVLLLATRDSAGRAREAPASRWLDPAAKPPRLPRPEILDLPPLDAAAVRAVVAELAGGAPSFALATTVESLCRGNPRLAQEAVERFREGGALTVRDGRADLDRIRAEASPPPASARLALVLDELGEGDRAVLEMASVLGDGFTSEVVAAALRSPRLAVLESLSRLERRHGFLRFASGRYLFRSRAHRDAVHESIHADLRRGLHTLAADVLRDAGGGRDLVRRCLHALRGHDPASGLALLPQALRASWGFEDRIEEMELLDAGLSRTPPDSGAPGAARMRCLLLARRADLLRRSGEEAEAARALREAREGAAGDAATLLAVELEWYCRLPAPAEARAAVRRLLRLHRAAGRAGGAAGGDLRTRTAFLLTALGRGATALRLAGAAIRLYAEAGDRVQAIRAEAIRGKALMSLGRTPEAADVLRGAFEAARREGCPRLACIAGAHLQSACFQLCRYRDALAAGEALERAAEDDAALRLEVLEVRSCAHLALGDYGRALACMDAGDELAASARLSALYNGGNRATVLAVLGEADAARRLARDAAERFRAAGEAGKAATPSLLLATLAEWEGRAPEAERICRDAVSDARADGYWSVASDGRGALARLRVASGVPGAGEAATEAIAEARRVGHTPSLIESLLALGEHRRLHGGDAHACADEAARLLQSQELEPIALLTLPAIAAGLLDRLGRPDDAAAVREDRRRRVCLAADTLADSARRRSLIEAALRLDRAYAGALAIPSGARP